MVKGKCKNLTNRNQELSPSSKPSTPNSASPGYPNTPEKKKTRIGFKIISHDKVEDLKKGINNSLKEIRRTLLNSTRT